jgi:hypothetical protein
MRSDRQDGSHTTGMERDRRGEAPGYEATRAGRRRHNPAKRLIPVLIMLGIGVLFARQQVPAFADWWERTFTPAVWQAKHTCRQAALDALEDSRYARLLDAGELHETRDGPYVADMRFSVLDTGGETRVVGFTCYLDSQGRLFRLNRDPG